MDYVVGAEPQWKCWLEFGVSNLFWSSEIHTAFQRFGFSGLKQKAPVGVSGAAQLGWFHSSPLSGVSFNL